MFPRPTRMIRVPRNTTLVPQALDCRSLLRAKIAELGRWSEEEKAKRRRDAESAKEGAEEELRAFACVQIIFIANATGDHGKHSFPATPVHFCAAPSTSSRPAVIHCASLASSKPSMASFTRMSPFRRRLSIHGEESTRTIPPRRGVPFPGEAKGMVSRHWQEAGVEEAGS